MTHAKRAANYDGSPILPKPAIDLTPLAGPSKMKVGAQENMSRDKLTTRPGGVVGPLHKDDIFRELTVGADAADGVVGTHSTCSCCTPTLGAKKHSPQPMA